MAWRSKNSYPKEIDGLNAVMTSLLVKDEHVYGIAGMGEMICQKLGTGEVVRTGHEIFGEKAAFCGSVFWVDAGEAVYGLTDQGDLVVLKLSPEKCEVLASAHILETTHAAKGRQGRVGAPGVRRQAHLHEERQGDRLRVGGRGVRLNSVGRVIGPSSLSSPHRSGSYSTWRTSRGLPSTTTVRFISRTPWL